MIELFIMITWLPPPIITLMIYWLCPFMRRALGGGEKGGFITYLILTAIPYLGLIFLACMFYELYHSIKEGEHLISGKRNINNFFQKV